MKAILLADTRVELYSTDAAPIGYVLYNKKKEIIIEFRNLKIILHKLK